MPDKIPVSAEAVLNPPDCQQFPISKCARKSYLPLISGTLYTDYQDLHVSFQLAICQLITNEQQKGTCWSQWNRNRGMGAKH